MIRIHDTRRVSTLIVLALALATTAYAQSGTATLGGMVVDETNAVVKDVTVTVLARSTGFQRQNTTDERGQFTFAALQPGRYMVRAARQGFTPVEVPDLTLNVDDVVSIRLQLKVEGVGESVTVMAEPARVNTSPAVGTVIDRRFVENLPLNGRSFQTLFQLTPGVVLTRSTFENTGQFSVNGQRTSANYFTIDGVSANIGVSASSTIGQFGSGALPGLSALGSSSNLVSVDALQEFRIQTSTYAPEFGRTPGGQISIVTRSGTNDIHGSLSEYFRNDALDANDWFANSRGAKKPPLRHNNYGGVIGGPLRRDKNFFFFSYEGLRLRLPQASIRAVPSMASRQAAPAAVKPILDAFPLPNGGELTGGLAEFVATYSDQSSLDAASVRIDHALTSAARIFGRYNTSPSKTSSRQGNNLAWVTESAFETTTVTGGATWVLSDAMVSDLRVNFSKSDATSSSSLDTFGGAIPPNLDSLFASFNPRPDAFGISVATGVSWSHGTFLDDEQRQVNMVETLSWSRGAHQVKFGVDYRRLTPDFNQRRYAPSIVFNNMAAALAAVANIVAINGDAGRRVANFTNLSTFAQDTWTATPSLTLTYGLRWEHNPPPKEVNGQDPYVIVGMDNPATATLAPPGTPLWNTSYKNFAPRAGVAYSLSRRAGRELVLRGGYGLFYDLGNGPAGNAFSFSAPYIGVTLLQNVPYPLDPVRAAPPPLSTTPPYRAIYTFDPDLQMPLSHQWNVSAEQSLGTHQTLTVSYVASSGRRLLRTEEYTAPNPLFALVRLTTNDAESSYRSLQLQFQRRLTRGLQALASYSWARSIDDVSEDSSFNVPLVRMTPDQERGPSSFDIRHTFAAAITYEIPAPEWGTLGRALTHNWSVDLITQARSAAPVNVITARDVFAAGFAGSQTSRPDVVSGQSFYVDDPAAPGGWRVNRDAFAFPTARQGTLGRNALRGFALAQTDVALRRSFRVSGRWQMQFAAEIFNVVNRPNFANPISDLSNPLFGVATQMLGRSLASAGNTGGFNPLYQIGGPRSIQLSLKVLY